MSTSAERLRIRVVPLDHPDARTLIEAIQALYVEIYGGRDDDRTADSEFRPPRGAFLVAYLPDPAGGAAHAVACGGWRLHEPGVAEIKRMFVVPEHRGRGLARSVLAALEQSAVLAGCERVVLNTGFRQVAAIRLYESSGYRYSAERYGRYAGVDGAFFFAKPLSTQQPAPDAGTGRGTRSSLSRG